MMLRLSAIAALATPIVALAVNSSVPGQAPGARPQFEAASIKPCNADSLPPVPDGARGGGQNSFRMVIGRTYAQCMTVATLVRTAYGYGPATLDFLNGGGRGRGLEIGPVYGLGVEDGLRVRGGPDWVRSDKYSIEAAAGGPANAETMRGAMLQDLLERRFQLKTHFETEQVAAFALTLAKGGLKIKPMAEDGCRQRPAPTPGAPVRLDSGLAAVRRGEQPWCGIGMERNGPNAVLIGGGAGLEGLASLLGAPLGGVLVLDRTGIPGRFNFVLEFAVDDTTPNRFFPTPPSTEPSDVPPGENIFTAVEDQLGLKLEQARAPREFIVIDQIERPSLN
jgi:uncharacterized protein (TIGR03435 family)